MKLKIQWKKEKNTSVEELYRRLEGDEETELKRGDSEMRSMREVRKHERWPLVMKEY